MDAALLAAGPVDTTLDSLARITPKLLGFVAIIAVGWLVAAGLRRLTARLLHRIDFSHALERGGLTRAGDNTYDPTAVLARAVYYAILLTAVTMAFGIFGRNPVSDLLQGLVAFLPKAAIAVVILLVSAAIARAVRDLVSGMLGGLSYARLMGNLAGFFLLGLGIIAALNQIGVATTVTTPVLVTVLATIGGILVVGVGGGLVRPMQRRWERWLDVAEREGRNISDTVQQNIAVQHNIAAQQNVAGHTAAEAPAADAPGWSAPVEDTAWPTAGEATGWPAPAPDAQPERSSWPRPPAEADDAPTQVFATVPYDGDYRTGR